MIKFLAIIAFCIEGQCAFWAETDKPYYTEKECQEAVVTRMKLMNAQGLPLESMLPACIPTKFYKSET
jgi:hypothetical protein